MTWRYIATRLHGDGTESILDAEVPLRDVELTSTLNGHGGLKANLSPEVERLRDDNGDPIFIPWATAIYAEASGQIRGGGILLDPGVAGPRLSLSCVGHTGYLEGMPYTGERRLERGDPLEVSWHLWEHTQERAGFDLNVARSGASESRELFLGDPDVIPSEVPQKVDEYVLAYYETHDLAKEFDHLAGLAPFEWTMDHAWDGDAIVHTLRYGYPRLGRRREDLRFVVGENVTENPPIINDEEGYASHVITLGAGEGRKMMRDENSRAQPGRLGRYAIVVDKSITTPAEAKARTQAELRARTGELDITTLEVADHPHAKVGTYGVGDDIFIQTGPGWYKPQGLWLKVLAITTRPDSLTTQLEVTRSEKVSNG